MEIILKYIYKQTNAKQTKTYLNWVLISSPSSIANENICSGGGDGEIDVT